jgi:hypothetical protein
MLFSGTPRVARFRARAGGGCPQGRAAPLTSWPRGTCREQGDAILSVSETPVCLNARSTWAGDLVAVLDVFAEDVGFRSPSPEPDRR